MVVVSVLSGLAALFGWVELPTAQGLPAHGMPSSAGPAAAPACALSSVVPDQVVSAALPEDRRGKVRQALRRGYGVQYWGESYTVASLAEAPHGLLIIEATRIGANQALGGREVRFSPEEIAKIRRNGTRPVLAYVNVAELEDYRDYWSPVRQSGGDPKHDRVQSWIGPRTDQAEQLARYWTPGWEAILLDRIDTLMALGFDGIFLDDAMHYFTFVADNGLNWTAVDRQGTPKDAPAHAQAMMRLVTQLAEQSRRRTCNAIVVVNNAVFISRDAGNSAEARTAFAQYLAAIDGILVETVFASPARRQVIDVLQQDFLQEGTAVLTLDFAPAFPGVQADGLRAWLAGRGAAAGFASYLAGDSLFDRLYPPITVGSMDRQPQ